MVENKTERTTTGLLTGRFTKLLIANRGEIACRIIRTARAMGVKTVAVYSDADASAQHVLLADEAIRIGPAPARESYLRGDLIIGAAEATGAGAIHPGYGFLSENEGFAADCTAAGIVFVGPPVEAIHAMGSKSEAKKLMEGSGVPLVPGYHGDAQDLETLTLAAETIGYPVLIKASAGGGGKGMRIVTSQAGLTEAIEGAKREAKSSFGDDHVLIEKYLTRPRHIEVQVFGDAHGNVVSLYERECTLQRRHQKVIEEAPSAKLTPAQRETICAAARAAASAIGYVGAGTVEFIAEGEDFYFIEMNTRLQVEHPVTEAITSQDLVAWQLKVAFGEPLPLRQEEIVAAGHAFEVRIYAEDPDRGFLPSIGHIHHWRQPASAPGIRVDTGFVEGDTITPNYDPMLAKLIVSGPDRLASLDRLADALARFEIGGVTTNIAFLQRLIANADVRAGDMDTGLIEREIDTLVSGSSEPTPADLAAAVAAVLAREEAVKPKSASPWDRAGGWMMTGNRRRAIGFTAGGATYEATLVYGGVANSIAVEIGDTRHTVRYVKSDAGLDVFVDGIKTRAAAVWSGRDLALTTPRGTFRLHWRDPYALEGADTAKAGRFTAPMPGAVTRILVDPGSTVTKGDPVLVIEAMKMEHTLRAPVTGRLVSLACSVGSFVDEGVVLGVFEADTAA
jgi:3-methylcrotonyl-CoA carboxylase alpha subunit